MYHGCTQANSSKQKTDVAVPLKHSCSVSYLYLLFSSVAGLFIIHFYIAVPEVSNITVLLFAAQSLTLCRGEYVVS